MDYVGCKSTLQVLHREIENSFIWTMWDVNHRFLVCRKVAKTRFIWTMWDVNFKISEQCCDIMKVLYGLCGM